MRKVLVLASGGLDSSVLVALYKNLGYEVHLLYMTYGNLNKEAELTKLNKLARTLGIKDVYIHPINLDYSNSGCIKSEGSSYYVEMRNLIFLSFAISIAEAKGIDEVAVGFIKTIDEYKDTTEDFVVMLNNLSVQTTGIEVKAPLKYLDKAGVYLLGKKLGVNLKDTFSCNKSNENPCGVCYDCGDIKKLIESCKIPDSDNPFI